MAVEPILASALWTADASCEPPIKRRKLSTGCSPIDSFLNGGFDYGSISCISAEADSGSKEISYALIASHLLFSDECEATIVDTANSFDVRRLHRRITSDLQERASGDGDVKNEAVRVLERVRIMKAFDFVGMTECVAEFREGLERRGHIGSPSQKPASASSEETGVPAPRGTVGDSEDEDEEEMLDGPDLTEAAPAPGDKSDEEETKEPSQHLLIIDNITSVTSPAIKNSHVQGQALLTTFMRSLAHLTQTHDICTIIHNTSATYSNSSTASASASTPSVFSSCTLVPALGKTFAYLLDLHLLLHRMPMTAADAKVVYAAHRSIPKSNQRMASVLEVLHDRHSDRVGDWCAFKPDAEGKLAATTIAAA